MATEKIDNDKEHELFANIRIMENENLKTKKYSDTEMVRRIMKYIKKVVDRDEEEDK